MDGCEGTWGPAFGYGVLDVEVGGHLYVFPLVNLPQKASTRVQRPHVRAITFTLANHMTFVLVFLLLFFYFLNELFVGSLLLYAEYFSNHTAVLSVFLC